MSRIPRRKDDDYTADAAAERREFAHQQTGVDLEHVGSFSVDPASLAGNIENFTGVAQVPLGLAGPLRVDGEYAQGDFYVPMATTEGTLVASYNRGMRLAREAGGIRVSVIDDAMQRAPVFQFADARGARAFGDWITQNFDEIKQRAEATTRVGKLRDIEQYGVSRFRFLRFNFTTGDAAGQNMVGRATEAACRWIATQVPEIERWLLTGNMDTDKKFSRLNTLRTRGKRVVAECTLPDRLLRERLRASAEDLLRQRHISNLGALMSASNNNGAHSANGIAAVFIATGQDEANVAESSAAIVHAELTPEGDYYYSITLPSLIVATYGGGTGLATQRECLELLGCLGRGKANTLAEIIAATVLAGELSLSGA
ncbi:MAG: hydroxymethylglutaryl-CoA reductase, partial [Acidobacteriota bacterium]